MASLQIVSGPGKGDTFQLTRMVTLIGRATGCDIILGDQTVSREHGQIEQHQDEWVYTNLSENGTWINRKRVDRIVLKNGDAIEVGSETRIKFLLKEPEKVEAESLVRRRARPSRNEAEEPPETEEEAPQAGQVVAEGLMKHRKMVIAIGIYLALILAVVIALKLHSGSATDNGPPVLRTYTKSEIQETAFNFTFTRLPVDSIMANKELQEAYRYYQQKDYGEGNLYKAIQHFEMCKAYEGGIFRNQKDFATCENAKRELAEIIWNLYHQGLLEEALGSSEKNFGPHRKEADNNFDAIQKQIRDKDNLFYKYIAARRHALSFH
jgi:pSer/pThr/pTyr-binding forkhead associated (FHA) protein